MLLRYFVILSILLASPLLHAVQIAEINEKPLIFDIENIFGVEWHNDHDLNLGATIPTDDFVKLTDELNLDLRWDSILLGTRFEVAYYPDKLVLKRELKTSKGVEVRETEVSTNDYRFEKYYFVFNKRPYRVDLGDYYITLGRGMALSMRKEGSGEIDNTLRGAKFEFNFSETKGTIFAGLTNTINVDPNYESTQQNPHDLIFGMRLEQRLFDFVSLGLQFVDTRYGIIESDYKKRFISDNETTIWGGSIEFPDIFGYVTAYTEVNAIQRWVKLVNDDLKDYEIVNDKGLGVYSSVSTFIESFTFTLEYKYYKDFTFKRSRTKLGYILGEDEEAPQGLEFFEDIFYNDAPTLERVDIETNRSYGNDHGFKAKASYNFFSTSTEPYLAFYYTINKSQEQGSTSLGGFGTDANEFEGDRIWHVYGGVTQHFGQIEAFIDAGFRDEYNKDKSEAILNMIHAKFGISSPFLQIHSLGLEAYYLRKDYKLLKQLEDDLDLTLSYTLKNWFTLSFFYTMQKQDFLPEAGEDGTNNFFAGEIASKFSDRIEFSIFGGQVRESYRCYGGFCRIIPAFEGIKGKFRIKY